MAKYYGGNFRYVETTKQPTTAPCVKCGCTFDIKELTPRVRPNKLEAVDFLCRACLDNSPRVIMPRRDELQTCTRCGKVLPAADYMENKPGGGFRFFKTCPYCREKSKIQYMKNRENWRYC